MTPNSQQTPNGSGLAGLRPLVAPVYLPSFVYSAGASVLVPVQVILALQLGFSTAGVTLMATVVGVFAVCSSALSGYIVHWLGESRAIASSTLLSIVALVAACACALAHLPTARWVLVVALLVVDLSDAVWSVGRQGLVADLAPPDQRGQAMNLYGACQRLGRMVGPFLAAAVLASAHAAIALPLSGAVMGVAAALFVRASLHAGHQAPESMPTSASTAVPRTPRRRQGVVMLAIGVVVLAALRTAKETLVPLWASQGVHLAPTHVALIVGLSSAMELVLFWPAGLALDRLGRAPVVVSALALMGLGLLVMPAHATAWWLIGASLLIGLGDGAGAGIVKTLGVDLAPTEGRSRFLGWWSAVASFGNLVAPAIATALIAAASLPASLMTLGGFGLAGACWMGWWTPKVLPGPGGRRQQHS